MIFIYFICKVVFNDKIDCEYCFDNYMYNYREVRKVLMFNTYNTITKLDIIYTDIVKYFNFLFFSERQRLFARNPPKDSRIVAKQTCVYKKALNNFTI